MTPRETRRTLAALRCQALDDLRETSDEQLQQEAADDGDDLDAVADRVRSTLRAAVDSALTQRMAAEGSADSSEVNTCEFQPDSGNRPSFANNRPRVGRVHGRQWGMAGAASLVGIAVIRMTLHGASSPPATTQTYQTSAGEYRTVVLTDGSIVTLNTKTQLTAVITNGDRRIQFNGGEALFEVVHDKTKPFTVALDGSVIRVLGTQFDVYRQAGGAVVVTVLKGSVAVRGLSNKNTVPSWVRTLTPNEQIEYTPSKVLTDVHQVDATEVTAWRKGILVIKGGTMRELVEELNRYSARPIILARDRRLERRQIAAVLSIDNIDETLQALQDAIPGLKISRTDDSTIVLSYSPDSRPSIGARSP